MRQKNVPQCIREGIFCLMTGAMVFAGSSMTVHAAEEAPADLPEQDGVSTDVNTEADNAVQDAADAATQSASDVADTATDNNYGTEQSSTTTEDTGAYYETQTTTTTYEETGTDFTSTTEVTTTDTQYDVENSEYYNKVKDGETAPHNVKSDEAQEATLVDKNGNPILDKDGNEQTAKVKEYKESTEYGHYETKDNTDGSWAPKEESISTQETTVTTDSRDVAEAIQANINYEKDHGGSSEIRDTHNNVISATTVSVSDITSKVSIQGTDLEGMGVVEGDSFKIKTDSDGNITIQKVNGDVTTDIDESSELYNIVKKAAKDADKSFYINGTETQVDGQNTYNVEKVVNEDGTTTTNVYKNGTKIEDTDSEEYKTVIDKTDTSDVSYVIAGTTSGTPTSIKASDLTDVKDLAGTKFNVSYSNVNGKETTTVTYVDDNGVTQTLTGDLADTIAENALKGAKVTTTVTYSLDGEDITSLAFTGIENVTFNVNTDTGVVTYVNADNQTVTVTSALAQKLVDVAKAKGYDTQTLYNLTVDQITTLENDGWTVVQGKTEIKENLTEAEKNALDATQWKITKQDGKDTITRYNLTADEIAALRAAGYEVTVGETEYKNDLTEAEKDKLNKTE